MDIQDLFEYLLKYSRHISGVITIRTEDSFPFYLLYVISEICFIVFSHIARFSYFLLFTFETSPGIDFPNSIHQIVFNHPSFNYIRLCDIFGMWGREMVN